MPREVTQARLARLSAGTLQHVPGQAYTVGDRVEERAARDPDRIFLFFEDRRIRYGEFNAAANRVAHAALAAGLRSGDVAALLMHNRPEFITIWAGLAKLGVVTALLNAHARGPSLRHALETANAKHLFVGAECLSQLRDGGRVSGDGVRVFVASESPTALPDGAVDLADVLGKMPSENPDSSVRSGLVAGDDLFHIFTSGTTGLPKAARLSHMRFLGVGDGMSAVAGYGPDEVIYCVLPLYHGAAGMVVVSCALAQGAAIALERRFSAGSFFDDARRYGVTACQYVGEICRYLLNQPPRSTDRDHSLRVMMGAGLGPDIWQAFRDRFGIEQVLEGWSSTEANTSLINVDNKIGSCGRIPFKELHNGRLIRFDVETESHPRDANGFCIECEAGEVGEFIGLIPDLPDSGAGRFEGYTSKAATDQKILGNVFARGDRWYRSGDLLRRDADDYFYFVDRIGDTFRWKSENVSTQEVAEALMGFPGLRIANVYGVKVPRAEGRAGMAALVVDEPRRFDGRAFYAFSAEHLPSYAAPAFVRLAPEADVTTTFKLRKVDLMRQGYDPSRVRDPLYVRDDGQRAYLPLTPASLEAAGYPPFEADPESG
jgi:fatty-acyl-CoA synthase